LAVIFAPRWIVFDVSPQTSVNRFNPQTHC
jgi:hypothetical protein